MPGIVGESQPVPISTYRTAPRRPPCPHSHTSRPRRWQLPCPCLGPSLLRRQSDSGHSSKLRLLGSPGNSTMPLPPSSPSVAPESTFRRVAEARVAAPAGGHMGVTPPPDLAGDPQGDPSRSAQWRRGPLNINWLKPGTRQLTQRPFGAMPPSTPPYFA
jgi:hypothetical protein